MCSVTRGCSASPRPTRDSPVVSERPSFPEQSTESPPGSHNLASQGHGEVLSAACCGIGSQPATQVWLLWGGRWTHATAAWKTLRDRSLAASYCCFLLWSSGLLLHYTQSVFWPKSLAKFMVWSGATFVEPEMSLLTSEVSPVLCSWC